MWKVSENGDGFYFWSLRSLLAHLFLYGCKLSHRGREARSCRNDDNQSSRCAVWGDRSQVRREHGQSQTWNNKLNM